jgi:hypothetical protein
VKGDSDMSDLGSKADVQDRDKRHQDGTNERLDHAREHEEQLERASHEWSAMEQPALTDTATALNQLADEFQREAHDQTQEQERTVDDGITTEHEEVSAPARDAETTERAAQEQLEHGATGTGDYEQQLHDAAKERDDAATFLDEIADGSEQHQHESKGEIDELSRAARAAAEAIKRF